MNSSTPVRTTATVKSPFLSKTNITAAVLGLLGLLATFGIIPQESVETTGGLIVTVGSVLIIAFRTFTSSVLRRS